MFQILEEIRMFPLRRVFPPVEVTQRMLILYKLVKRRIDNIGIEQFPSTFFVIYFVYYFMHHLVEMRRIFFFVIVCP